MQAKSNRSPKNFLENSADRSLVTDFSIFKPGTAKLVSMPTAQYYIPTLTLLDDMTNLVKQLAILPDLKNTMLIGVQHILETTVTLFDKLHELGIDYENMYFSGKCYSTSPEIEAQVLERGIHLMPSNKPEEPGMYEKYCRKGMSKMWEKFRERITEIQITNKQQVDMIIILDEGGRCLEGMPEDIGFKYRIAAIEQTRAGLYSESMNLLPFPLIEVASCAVKKLLEPVLIAAAILNRLKSLLGVLNPHKNTVFGIIGNGAIGYGICQYLLLLGYTVIVYDSNESAFENIVDKKFYRVGSINEVISGANIIFGCTGKDVTHGIDVLSIVKKQKIFISCTSEDREFNSLLQKANQNFVAVDTLSDLVCLSNNGSKIIILQGGFPFNFDRKPWNVPAADIEVTQGLLLGAVIQAITCATKPVADGKTINHGSRQALNPFIQRYVAMHWLPRQPIGRHNAKYKDTFDDIEWILKGSGGEYHDNHLLSKCFNSVQSQLKQPMARL